MPAPNHPNGRRTYDLSGRQAAARLARQRVVDACRQLVVRDGYRATTMRAVAERAGVSVESVYKSFTSKARLVKQVYDVTIAGDDAAVPLGDRTELRQVFEAPDGRQKVHRYAAFVTGYHQKVGVLEHVLAEADPDVAALRTLIDQERLTGLRAFVDHLAHTGALRTGVARSTMAEGWLVLTSSMVFTQLVRTLGWETTAYQEWLENMLAASLLPDRHHPRPGSGTQEP